MIKSIETSNKLYRYSRVLINGSIICIIFGKMYYTKIYYPQTYRNTVYDDDDDDDDDDNVNKI